MKRIILLILVATALYSAEAQTVTTTKVTAVNNTPVITTTETKTVTPVGKNGTVIVHEPIEIITPSTPDNYKHLPPGQAKKIYGHQSAKNFAPGQTKKKHDWKKHNNSNEVLTHNKRNKKHEGHGHDKGHKKDKD